MLQTGLKDFLMIGSNYIKGRITTLNYREIVVVKTLCRTKLKLEKL